jgi:hypothetical protein
VEAPDLDEVILKRRDLCRLPGFTIAFAPTAEIVRREQKDPKLAGVIVDGKSIITVTEEMAQRCLELVPSCQLCSTPPLARPSAHASFGLLAARNAQRTDRIHLRILRD